MRLGADYLGVIFAGGPRLLTVHRAREVLAASAAARRVGVFGAQPPEEIGRTAREVALDVVQLHGDPDARAVDAVRREFEGLVWAVVRVDGADLPTGAERLLDIADAVVLDARIAGRLGGTGVKLDWDGLAPKLREPGRAGRLVLAGGLTPENVADGIGVLAPDVVDVSSGVERAPGVKDHERMRAFAAEVRRATAGAGTQR